METTVSHNMPTRSVFVIYQGTCFRLPFGAKVKMSVPEKLYAQVVANPKAIYALEAEVTRLFQEHYPNTPLPSDFWDTVMVEAVHPISGMELIRGKREEVEHDEEQKRFGAISWILALLKLPLLVLGIWLMIMLGVVVYGLLSAL